MTNRVVFLDIDGPMIPTRASFLPDQPIVMTKFDPCAVGMLNSLLDRSGAKLVISSTWSKLGLSACQKALCDNGLPASALHKDWKTIKRISSSRTQEIVWWLEDHQSVEYVILDDERLSSLTFPGFVQCDTYEGFSFRNYLESLQTFGLTDSKEDELLVYLRRNEVWRTQRTGDPHELRTWEFSDKLFPVQVSS